MPASGGAGRTSPPGTGTGRASGVLGGGEDFRYSRPYLVPAGHRIDLTTAQRWDLFVVPDRVGTFTVGFDVHHWVRGYPHGRVETTITVT
jgi:hypothetical protein